MLFIVQHLLLLNLLLLNLITTSANPIPLTTTNTSCLCPSIDNKINIELVSINSSYGEEWWYFLHNVIDDTSPIVSVENTLIRRGGECNGMSEYIYQESILWKNGSFTKNMVTEEKKDTQEALTWIIGNRRFIVDKKTIYYLELESNNTRIRMEGYGFPQGKQQDGFVRTGSEECDTSYTISFLDLQSTVNNFTTVSYGEHVYTTQLSKPTHYVGWNCHYIHNFNPKVAIKAYLVCQSKFKNTTIVDPYQRSLILWNNNTTFWTNNFSLKAIYNWTNTNSGVTYPISWEVTLVKKYTHYLIANTDLQEVFSMKNFYFWDGSVTVWDNELGFIGVGFNEILKTRVH